MNVEPLHPFDLTPKAAIALQRELAGKIEYRGCPRRIRTLAAVDCAVSKDRIYGAIVLLSYPELTTITEITASEPLTMPYIPGLLSFRELPVLVSAFRQLNDIPDLVMVDGNGVLHPRRLGLASHLGLMLGITTIGCAKNLFCGTHRPLGRNKGATASLKHRGEIIGTVLRTRENTKPVYISVGHKISLRTAVRITMRLSPKYRIPEPIRRADSLSRRARIAAST